MIEEIPRPRNNIFAARVSGTEADMCAERSKRAVSVLYPLPRSLRVRQWAIIPQCEDPELEEWMISSTPDAGARVDSQSVAVRA
ncbi:hypothetical protein X566_02245 [Afipia sp. P52-10]|nr:hypothetical protein X566_02245 [Afipia sp. P52-10]